MYTYTYMYTYIISGGLSQNRVAIGIRGIHGFARRYRGLDQFEKLPYWNALGSSLCLIFK